jgi:hypothetical protein
MAAPATVIPSRSAHSTGKLALWIMLGLAAFFVLLASELPLLHAGTMYDAYRAQLTVKRGWVLVTKIVTH